MFDTIGSGNHHPDVSEFAAGEMDLIAEMEAIEIETNEVLETNEVIQSTEIQPVVKPPQKIEPVLESPQEIQPVLESPQEIQPVLELPQEIQPVIKSPQVVDVSVMAKIKSYWQPPAMLDRLFALRADNKPINNTDFDHICQVSLPIATGQKQAILIYHKF